MTKDKDKKLCDLAKKDLSKKDLDSYRELVNGPRYLCKKCGRLANRKKNLCKGTKL